MPTVSQALTTMSDQNIQNKIYTIREMQVMLDRDLASLYGVETKVFNQAVKRNIKRFPQDFMFQLTKEELDNWRSQFVTSSSDHGGRRYLPYVFTEQGVSMLSSILKSDTAIEVSIQIARMFVQMRKFVSLNASLFQRLDALESKQFEHKLEADKNFNKIFNAIEDKSITKKQGIFFNGQIFDAYVFMSSLIKEAKTSIVLIDNYIDKTTLVHLSSKSAKDVKIAILTKSIGKATKLDLKKHSEQYANIELKELKHSHDRFLLIDEKIYHLGASLKDLGKKWFAFSLIEEDAFELKKRVSEVLNGK